LYIAATTNQLRMTTMFECWNGGRAVYHNQQPCFIFDFPAQSAELLTFFQFSGRICELLTGYNQSQLVMGGQPHGIPDFPKPEVDLFVQRLQAGMGYYPYIRDVMTNDNFGQMWPMRVALWVNLGTGRADTYHPMAGLQPGLQFIPPQQQFQPAFYGNYAVQVQQGGAVQGSGKTNTVQKIGGILKDINTVLGEGSKMFDFFNSRFG
jgi:hypothetical protein